MDRFAAIDAFVRVAEASSFAGRRASCACRARSSPRVQQLEAFVGAPLFHRSTRSVRLSELGESFLPDCLDLVRRSDGSSTSCARSPSRRSAACASTALPGFVLGHLATLLQAFQARYPQIVLDIVVSDAAIDPLKGLRLRAADLSAALGGADRPAPVRRAPDLLRNARLPAPAQPSVPRDLLKHRLCWYSGYPTRDRVVFYGEDGPVALDLKPTLLPNSVHLLREAAFGDGGIVCLPTLVAADAVLDGRLSLVLPDRQLSSFWLSVFYPAQVRRTLSSSCSWNCWPTSSAACRRGTAS